MSQWPCHWGSQVSSPELTDPLTVSESVSESVSSPHSSHEDLGCLLCLLSMEQDRKPQRPWLLELVTLHILALSWEGRQGSGQLHRNRHSKRLKEGIRGHTVVQSIELQGKRGAPKCPYMNMHHMWICGVNFRHLDCQSLCIYLLRAALQKVGQMGEPLFSPCINRVLSVDLTFLRPWLCWVKVWLHHWGS